MRCELSEPWTFDADFYGGTQDINLPDELTAQREPGMSNE
jgi:hypothetical protein